MSTKRSFELHVRWASKQRKKTPLAAQEGIPGLGEGPFLNGGVLSFGGF